MIFAAFAHIFRDFFEITPNPPGWEFHSEFVATFSLESKPVRYMP
jgi:hypothetical protein